MFGLECLGSSFGLGLEGLVLVWSAWSGVLGLVLSAWSWSGVLGLE